MKFLLLAILITCSGFTCSKTATSQLRSYEKEELDRLQNLFIKNMADHCKIIYYTCLDNGWSKQKCIRDINVSISCDKRITSNENTIEIN